MSKYYEDYHRLETEYKQLMKTKEELSRLKQRQKEEEDWKVKIDQEFDQRNKQLERD